MSEPQAGIYRNTTAKPLWVSGTTLVGVTETTTSATYLYWQPNNRMVPPGDTVELSAEEAATAVLAGFEFREDEGC